MGAGKLHRQLPGDGNLEVSTTTLRRRFLALAGGVALGTALALVLALGADLAGLARGCPLA